MLGSELKKRIGARNVNDWFLVLVAQRMGTLNGLKRCYETLVPLILELDYCLKFISVNAVSLTIHNYDGSNFSTKFRILSSWEHSPFNVEVQCHTAVCGVFDIGGIILLKVGIKKRYHRNLNVVLGTEDSCGKVDVEVKVWCGLRTVPSDFGYAHCVVLIGIRRVVIHSLSETKNDKSNQKDI